MLLAACLVLGGAAAPAHSVGQLHGNPAPLAGQPALSQEYRRLPVAFERNEGQSRSGARYIAHLAHAGVLLTATDVVLDLGRGGRRVDLHPIGSNPRPTLLGLDRLPGRVSYLVGASPRGWHVNVPTYARVLYRDLYPHIDLALHGRQGQLEYDWVLHPGAHLSSVRLRITGGAALLDRDGSMSIRTPGGDVRQDRPRLYQGVGASRRSVAGGFELAAAGVVRIWAGRYDPSRTLVVDPVLRFSTLLGGSSSDWGSGITVNRRGDVYMVGSTESSDYPLVHPFSGPHNGPQEDVAVSELNATGDALLFSTYLGGEADDDATGIALDAGGDVYVTGLTQSIAFPTLDPLPGGRCNGRAAKSGHVFMAELRPAGNALVRSTCLGGRGTDWPAGIAVDASGAVYLAGTTSSDDFPLESPWQARRAGGTDVFVAKLLRDRLVFSTFLGGRGDDLAGGVAIDGQGAVYVTGTTDSPDFPTRNALQPGFAGGSGGVDTGDAFVAMLDSRGRLVYSTFLGGKGDDGGTAIAVDAAGDAYVAGATTSKDFPTANPWQAASGGGHPDGTRAFLARIAPGGTRLVYSTFLGGDGRNAATGIALDGGGDAYLVGSTSSSSFPVLDPVQPRYAGGYYYGDAFLARFDPMGKPTFASYFGGRGDDTATGVAVDARGAAYLTGGTSSTDFPTTTGVAGTTPDRGNAFIVKVDTASADGSADGVHVDRLSLFTQGKNGAAVASRSMPEGGTALFVVLFHTVGETSSAVQASIWFTANGRTVGRETMRPGTSDDRRPMVSATWRVPRDVHGRVIVHVRLTLRAVSDTRTLKFIVGRARR